MKEYEAVKQIEDKRKAKHFFVKWWRKEQDFMDYDLIERFMRNVDKNQDIGGFELLTMDEMWSELQRVAGNHVKLEHGDFGGKIYWVHKGKSGINSQVCDYTPANLMTIFDIEIKNNPVG
jgi:hypothetical protein